MIVPKDDELWKTYYGFERPLVGISIEGKACFLGDDGASVMSVMCERSVGVPAGYCVFKVKKILDLPSLEKDKEVKIGELLDVGKKVEVSLGYSDKLDGKSSATIKMKKVFVGSIVNISSKFLNDRVVVTVECMDKRYELRNAFKKDLTFLKKDNDKFIEKKPSDCVKDLITKDLSSVVKMDTKFDDNFTNLESFFFQPASYSRETPLGIINKISDTYGRLFSVSLDDKLVTNDYQISSKDSNNGFVFKKNTLMLRDFSVSLDLKDQVKEYTIINYDEEDDKGPKKTTVKSGNLEYLKSNVYGKRTLNFHGFKDDKSIKDYVGFYDKSKQFGYMVGNFTTYGVPDYDVFCKVNFKGFEDVLKDLDFMIVSVRHKMDENGYFSECEFRLPQK